MILPRIIEIISAESEAGTPTDENRYGNPYTEDAVHRGRAAVLFEAYRTIKRINPIWTQQYYAKFSLELQDDPCVRRFKVPPVLTLDTFYDGFLYVGSIEGNCAYTKLANRASLANSEQNRYSKLQEDQVKFIYSDGYIECYGNPELEDLRVDGIFLNPTDVPTWNKNVDQYPLDEALILRLKEVLFGGEIRSEISQPFKVKNQNTAK